MQIWSWKIEGEKSHKNSIWEALGLHLGGVWEALGRLLEALGRLLGAIFRIFSLIFGYLNSSCVFFWDFLPQDGLKSGFWEGLGEVWGRIWAGFRVIFLDGPSNLRAWLEHTRLSPLECLLGGTWGHLGFCGPPRCFANSLGVTMRGGPPLRVRQNP